MTMRFLACSLVCALFFTEVPAASRTQPIRLSLIYTTSHGGIPVVDSRATRNIPKLGLALAGGGAKAAASIGVLRVLEEANIPVAMIAGTSMGSGVGGLYAAGYSPDEIEAIFVENDWNDIFTDTPRRVFQTQEQKEAGSRHLLEFTFHRGRFMPPSGLTAGQKLTNLLASKTLAATFEANLDFDRLRVPFRAVATDIETGDEIAVRRGLLHEAIRASAAIPVVFQPVEIDGRMLVDGGMVNNLPVEVVKSMGAEVVIAVDASTRLEKKEQLGSLLDVMGQSISLQVRRETERQARLADLVITPDTSAYSFADFPSMYDIIRKGEEAARQALPRIRALLRPRPPQAFGGRFRITSFEIKGNGTPPEDAIRSIMERVLSPHETGPAEVLEALEDVYKLGLFADVSVDLEEGGNGIRAVLHVKENPVVHAIELSGNTLLSDNDIRDQLSWQPGAVLNTARLTADLDRLVGQCRSRGYLLTRIARAGMMPDNSTLMIEFYEGRVDSIAVTGQRKTQRSLIRRETALRAGGPLNFDTAAHDIQRLYALDYFESLSADMARSPAGGVDILLKIREKPTTKVRLGLRYDLDDRFTGLTDIVADNVTGRGIKTFLNMRYGNYYDFTLGYHSPVLLHTNFVHTLQSFYRSREYAVYQDQRIVDKFEITRTGADLAFGYQWFRFGDTYLRYRYLTDITKNTFGAGPEHDTLRIGSLAFLSTVDTRDRNTFPDSGILFKGSYEAARPEYGSSNTFARTSLYAQGVLPLADRHAVIIEGSCGIGTGSVPYQEQFGIGGADYLLGYPLAGYQRREFTGPYELGFGMAYRWKIRDYQLKAVKAVYLNIMGQAANVWETGNDIAINDLRAGAGIGLHADTVLGPFRLDVGMGEQNRTAVYFSAGFDF